MSEHSTTKERVEYGLSTIPKDRSVVVSLRDLMYVHQTLAEFVRFFHQPMHYPDLRSVQTFLGSRNSGDAIDVLCESLYNRMREMMPQDIEDALGDGERFEHPKSPNYFEPS